MSVKSSVFKPVVAADRVDYPQLEHTIQQWWDDNTILQQYLYRNENSDKQYSFLDGPITANNPMGVHHAWGRTYKDLYQRFKTMQGFKQRYQNGFDCQGLWVEVNVEQELGLKTKRLCERVSICFKFAQVDLVTPHDVFRDAIDSQLQLRLPHFLFAAQNPAAHRVNSETSVTRLRLR